MTRRAFYMLCMVGAWLGATLWLRPLAMPDEGRYVSVAWEMVRSGNWLTPTLDGLPFFHKPPLFYWIAASAMSVFGVHDWAVRLAPWGAAVLLTMAAYGFVGRWVSEKVAHGTVVVMVTQPLVFGGAQYANHDMLVAGCIGITVLLAAHGVLLEGAGGKGRRWIVAAYAVAALGILSKGLIGGALPLLALSIWALVPGRPKAWARLVSPMGLVAFLVVAVPWFAINEARHPGFLHYFFIRQQFDRFVGAEFNNLQPWWFYPALLFGSALPWTAWLVMSLRRRAARGDGIDATGVAAGPGDARNAVRRLMWIWLLVIVVFFSLPHSKLIGYILPATAPLAFLVADAAHRMGSLSTRGWKASFALSLAVCAGVVFATRPGHMPSNKDLADSYVQLRSSGEPLVFMETYFYDVVYYARLDAPIAVVNDWDDSEMNGRDNWEREIFDAGEFAPAAAHTYLVEPELMNRLLCEGRIHWMMATRASASRNEILSTISPSAVNKKAGLWKVDNRSPQVARLLHCELPPPGNAL